MSARRAAQPRKSTPLMTWRAPRLPRAAHLALALLVAAGLIWLGAWLTGTLISDDNLSFAVGLLWGWCVGMAVVAYWAEVIDR